MWIDPKLQEKMYTIFKYILSPEAISKKFQNLLEVLAKQVMAEDKTSQDDLVKLWNKKKS